MIGVFLQRYEKTYDIRQDQFYEGRLILFDDVFIDFCEEDFQKSFPSSDRESDVEVCDGDKNICNIYKEFSFTEDDSVLSHKMNALNKLLLLQGLGAHSNDPPEIDYGDCMCPVDTELVGYFNIPIDFERIDSILSTFSQIQKDANCILDVKYLTDNHKEHYDNYIEYCEEIEYSFYCLLESKPTSAANIFPDVLTQQDNVFVNKDKTMLVGFDPSTLEKIIHKFSYINSFFRSLLMLSNLFWA